MIFTELQAEIRSFIPSSRLELYDKNLTYNTKIID